MFPDTPHHTLSLIWENCGGDLSAAVDEALTLASLHSASGHGGCCLSSFHEDIIRCGCMVDMLFFRGLMRWSCVLHPVACGFFFGSAVTKHDNDVATVGVVAAATGM